MTISFLLAQQTLSELKTGSVDLRKVEQQVKRIKFVKLVTVGSMAKRSKQHFASRPADMIVGSIPQNVPLVIVINTLSIAI